ncbi:MAG: aryl-sulfate sulfotransferase [Ignavibacteriales bacterium]|nr:aryl-sulfate sulfotransferase [Ignavibacteriales bacterium]
MMNKKSVYACKQKKDHEQFKAQIGRGAKIFFLPLLFLLMNFVFVPSSLYAQAYEGYTLFSPNNSRNTYLINMSNQVVHSWSHTKTGGYSCYLLEDGTLLRSAASSNSQLNGGGAAGIVQKVDWGGNVIWEYTYSSSTYRSHHDIEPMPNGNVLLIAWEVKTAVQAVQTGLNHSAVIWPDHIIEVEPVGTNSGNIVWQWHAWDHLVQDYDAAKNNYGVVADHPELLDINMGGTQIGDWMHINGISYNVDLDQIVISSHFLDEIYVIDHSTTTAEAAAHSGGRSGKGGDILYRWGNPANYNAPGSQVFNVVHSSIWIPNGFPGSGNILAFNNREGQGTSIVVEIVPPVDGSGSYTISAGSAFGPTLPTWSYTASGFYSNHLGGCQRLSNGNTLIVESTSGYLFEVDASGNVVWTYNRGGEIARALRYSTEYIDDITDVEENEELPSEFKLSQNYPNPFNPETTIEYVLPEAANVTLKVFDVLGREVTTLVNEYKQAGIHYSTFSASQNKGGQVLHSALSSGVYFYTLRVRDSSPGKSGSELQKTKKMILAK